MRVQPDFRFSAFHSFPEPVTLRIEEGRKHVEQKIVAQHRHAAHKHRPVLAREHLQTAPPVRLHAGNLQSELRQRPHLPLFATGVQFQPHDIALRDMPLPQKS